MGSEHLADEWFDVSQRHGRYEVHMKITGEYRHRLRGSGEEWRPGRPENDDAAPRDASG